MRCVVARQVGFQAVFLLSGHSGQRVLDGRAVEGLEAAGAGQGFS